MGGVEEEAGSIMGVLGVAEGWGPEAGLSRRRGELRPAQAAAVGVMGTRTTALSVGGGVWAPSG